MEDETTLRSLVYLLPRESVDVLLNSSRTLCTLVTRLEDDNIHWLRKVAYDFDLIIPEDKYYEDDSTPTKASCGKTCIRS